MELLCHRGWWRSAEEKNAATALARAFDSGLGVETDLRDLAGSVVVSHDPPVEAALDLAGLLDLYKRAASSTLALNVKADGLSARVVKLLADRGLMSAAFVFDMAVPDQLHWLESGVAVFTRHSDVEPYPVLYERAAGVWLDDFGPQMWWTAQTVTDHLDKGKRVAVVSPELHGRDRAPVWQELRAAGLHLESDVLLCTDAPGEALEFFM